MGPSGRVDADPSSSPLVHVGSFATEDPCAHSETMVPWDTVITPLSRGPYTHSVTFLASPGLILYREYVRTRVRVQGILPQGLFAFTVPLHCGSHTSYWGSALHERGLPVTMPGGLHADLSAGQQHLIALIDLRLFLESAPEELKERIEKCVCGHLAPATRDAVARLGATLDALLNQAQANPLALQHSHAISSMEQDVLAAFWRALTRPLPARRRVGRAIRQRGLQRAVEYLRSADAALVTVSDLCAAARVSERTLEYAFREAVGVTPLGFIHLRRYRAARRDLLAADGKTATIQTIAQQNGFYQMGRFAARYRALFGESPSDTLAKPPVETRCGLPHGEGLGLR